MVCYKQFVYNEEINLSNLALYVGEKEEYVIKEKKKIYDDKAIRIFLLENGLAKLSDLGIAEDDEIEAQDKAKKNNNGLWREGTDANKRSLHSIFNTIYVALDHYIIIALVRIIMFIGIGGLFFRLYKWICKLIRSINRVDVVLMGGIASGKTTIIRRLKNPNMSAEKLQAMVTSTKSREVSRVEMVRSGGKSIHLHCIDNPGNDISAMLDETRKFKLTGSSKNVVVFIISFGADNKIDNEYINQQMMRASIMMQIIKKSKALSKNTPVVVFFNKCDLIHDDRAQGYFRDGTYDKVKSVFSDWSEDLKVIYDNADCVLYGSALQNLRIGDLCQQILELY